jgi:hypothetical protein
MARPRNERLEIVAGLTADLGHTPSTGERLLIDELAGLAVRARRLRACGKPTKDIARLMTRVAVRLGIDADPHRARKQKSVPVRGRSSPEGLSVKRRG